MKEIRLVFWFLGYELQLRMAARHCRELSVTTATTGRRLYTHRRVSEKEADHDYLKNGRWILGGFFFVYSYSHTAYLVYGNALFVPVFRPPSARWWHVASSPLPSPRPVLRRYMMRTKKIT